ncbi:MAG: hypothetical protein HXX16_00585 [Bacteroidales bacterium]|nr:hypothetical protein [Bacteroidales bacterium]
MAKTKNNATTKILSASFSYPILNTSVLARIDKKENKLLPANKIHATPVNSSINDASLYFEILSDVKTTRQNPNKLVDVFKI